VAAVARACEKDPALRYQSAAALKEDLACALGPAFALPPGATPAPLVSYASLQAAEPGREPSGTIRLGSVGSSPSLPGVRPSTSGQQPLATPPPPPAPAWLGRRKLLVVAAVAVVLALVLLALVLRPGPPPAPPSPAPVAEPVAAPVQPPPTAPAPPAEPDDLTLAREHLAAGHARQARALLEALLVKKPDDAEQLRLLGHAFFAEGEAPKAVDAWTRAQELAPLTAAELEKLAGLLGRDRPMVDRAAPLLVKAGATAGPALERQLDASSTLIRLRALAVAREIGPTARVDVLGGYLALLSDPDCDVRKAAARGLGELKDRRALPRLKEKAAEKIERRGLFGVILESRPACGAPEAAEAVRRLEAR
jgi:serine/threonine-protein kinase